MDMFVSFRASVSENENRISFDYIINNDEDFKKFLSFYSSQITDQTPYQDRELIIDTVDSQRRTIAYEGRNLKVCFINLSEFRDRCEYSVIERTYDLGYVKVPVVYKCKVTCTDTDDEIVVNTLKYGRNYFFEGLM